VPIYEFACEGCGRKSSVFQRRITVELSVACPHCGSTSLTRLVSNFAVLRSNSDSSAAEGLAGLDENDPASMERWAREMGEEMGSDLGADMDDDFGGGGGLDGLGDDFDD
jgi:putative FmdB family regulatory protein